jgi:hypothetical protein
LIALGWWLTGGGSRDSGYQVVKIVEPKGRWTSATKVVASVRDGRPGYAPRSPFSVDGLCPLSPA